MSHKINKKGQKRYQSFQQYSRYSYVPPRKSKGKKVAKIIGITLASLLLVCGIGIVTYATILKDKMGLDDLDSLLDELTPVSGNAFYTLVMGSDQWENISDSDSADAMVLIRVDLDRSQLTMVSIPRDTPYQHPTYGLMKLKYVYKYDGAAGCIKAVEEVTGIQISHYVEVHFDELENVVNALGGITVDVPYAFRYSVYTGDQASVYVPAGEQHLNANQVVALARNRVSYDSSIGQDAVRQINIKRIMMGILKEVFNCSATELPSRISTCAGMIKTDIGIQDLLDWGTKIYSKGKLTVYSITGPEAGSTWGPNGEWLCYEDPEGWSKVIAAVETGKDPTKYIEGTTDEEDNLSTSSKNVITFSS